MFSPKGHRSSGSTVQVISVALPIIARRVRFSLLRIIASPRSPFYRPSVVKLLLPRDFNEDAYTYLHADVRDSSMTASQHYLLHGYAERRNYCQVFSETPLLVNPIAGLNLTAYHVAQRLSEDDSPLSHYLLAGEPTGPWTAPVIRADSSSEVSGICHAVVHFHCFHLELLAEFLEFAQDIIAASTKTLVISYSDPIIGRQISRSLHEIPDNFRVVRVNNHGRNFGALAQLLELDEFAQFDVWAHFHSKLSQHLPGPLVREWRKFIYRSLLGNAPGKASFDDILGEFFRLQDLGIVYPDDPHEFGWGENLGIGQQMARAMGFDFDKSPPKFPVGGMFVARRSFLTELFNGVAPFTNPVTEPLPHDGTPWHAFERLLGVAPPHLGFRAAGVRADAEQYTWLRSS